MYYNVKTLQRQEVAIKVEKGSVKHERGGKPADGC